MAFSPSIRPPGSKPSESDLGGEILREQRAVADVPAQAGQRGVSGLPGNLDLAHPGSRGARGEARPQRVPGVARRGVEPGGPGAALNDQGDGLP